MSVDEELFSGIAPEGDAYFFRHLVLDPRRESGHVPMREREPILMRRDYYDVFIHLAGEGELNVVGSDGRVRSTQIRPGRIHHWRPQDHRYRALSTMDPVEFYEVGIRSNEWQMFTTLLGIPLERLTSAAAPVALFDPRQPDVPRFFEELGKAAHAGAPMEALVRFLVEIVPRLYSPGATVEGTVPRWLFAGVESMREEENLRLGMPRLLELTRLSPRQLARLTQRYFAMTPRDVINEARLRHAMRLLRAGSESISAIAERCGYSSPAYFSYSFTTATGLSPRTYRQRGLSGFHGARAPVQLTDKQHEAGVYRPSAPDSEHTEA